MDSKPRWYAYAAIALATISLLLALYVGAYYAMVHPVPFAYSTLHGETTWWYPEYGDFPPGEGVTFFEPIHSLDRRLRPEVWDPQPQSY